MGVTVFPAATAATSPIKSIQRGYAGSAGTITITAVDTSKTFVKSFSSGSGGSVGITGNITGTLGPSGGATGSSNNVADFSWSNNGSFPSYSGTRTLSAGATDVTTRLYGVVLTNSTTLTADGPCYWEVVEYI